MVGVKCQISVDCVLYQPINDFVTDPPVTFHNKEMNILLLGDESEISTQVAEFSVQLTKHIDEFLKRGSGWVFRTFVRCDVRLLKYDPLKETNICVYLKLSKRKLRA